MLLQGDVKKYCLLLDKRYDEKDRITREFGEDVRFFIAGDGETLPRHMYDHIDCRTPPSSKEDGTCDSWSIRPNSFNAFCCFKAIIREAIEKDYKAILILEDDAQKTEQFDEILAKSREQLIEKGVTPDIMYLGANHTFAHTVPISENILRVRGSGCFHAVILRNTSYQAILDLTMTAPIDKMVADHLHRKMICYAIYPSIVVQRPGFSFCENREVDYLHYFDSRGKNHA